MPMKTPCCQRAEVCFATARRMGHAGVMLVRAALAAIRAGASCAIERGMGHAGAILAHAARRPQSQQRRQKPPHQSRLRQRLLLRPQRRQRQSRQPYRRQSALFSTQTATLLTLELWSLRQSLHSYPLIGWRAAISLAWLQHAAVSR